MNEFNKRVAFLFVVASCAAVSVYGEEVDWVSFPDWSEGDLSGIGTAPELSISAEFTTLDGVHHERFPTVLTVEITSPSWPFDNRDVPLLWTRSPDDGPDDLEYDLVFSFTNPEGLLPGGSIIVADIESPETSVQLIGFKGGERVDVEWTVSFLEVAGEEVAAFPNWNPATSTLSGTTDVDPDDRNATFLVSNRHLDEVRFDVFSAREGIGFNAAAIPVFVPEPSAFVLLTTSLSLLVLSGFRGKQQSVERKKSGGSTFKYF